MQGRPLHAAAAAVHQPHGQEAVLPAGVQVLLRHRQHVRGRKRVQVELLADGKDEGRVVAQRRPRAAAAAKKAGRYSASPSSSRL